MAFKVATCVGARTNLLPRFGLVAVARIGPLPMSDTEMPRGGGFLSGFRLPWSGFLEREQGGRQLGGRPVQVLDRDPQGCPYRDGPRAHEALEHLLGIPDRIEGPAQTIHGHGVRREWQRRCPRANEAGHVSDRLGGYDPGSRRRGACFSTSSSLPWPRIPCAECSCRAASERGAAAAAGSQGGAPATRPGRSLAGALRRGPPRLRACPLPRPGIDRLRAGSFLMNGSVGADAVPVACSGSRVTQADLSGG